MELSVSVKDLTKDMTANSKALNSVGNKQDELKKTVDLFRHRIEKLENDRGSFLFLLVLWENVIYHPYPT